MFKLVDYGSESRLYYFSSENNGHSHKGKMIASINKVGFTIYATNSNLEVRSYRVSRIIMNEEIADSFTITKESDIHYYYSFSNDFVTSTNYPCDLDVPDIMKLSEDIYEQVLAVSEILDVKHDEAMSKIYVYIDDKEFKECGKYMDISIDGNVVTLNDDERYRFVTRGMTYLNKEEIVSSLIKQYMQSLI